jgi:hypothetical protein
MKNIKLITNLMIAILAGIQFSYGQLEAELELEQFVSTACIGYTIKMSNLNAGDQRFRYLDCDGLEVEIIQAPKTGVMTYSFCGLENQDIQRDFVYLTGDSFKVKKGACNLTPDFGACIGYTIDISNLNAGDQRFRYFDCDGLEVEIIQAQKTGVMTYSFCGLENQDIQREFVYLTGDTFNVTEGACNNPTPILGEYTAPLRSSNGGDRSKSRQEGEPFNAKVFPNPTNGNATLTWDEDEVTTLTIIDLSGKQVLNQIIAKGTRSASFTINDPGVYFALIEQNGEKKWSGKIVKL